MNLNEAIERLKELAKDNEEAEKHYKKVGLWGMETYSRGKKQAFNTAVEIVEEYQEAPVGEERR